MSDDHTVLRNRDLPLAQRCRLAFLAGSLEAWRAASGADPPPDVLARILARYPGDPGKLARPSCPSRSLGERADA